MQKRDSRNSNDSRERRGRRPRRDRRPKKVDDLDQRVIQVARVARVVAGGRRFRFRAAVVVGNRKGKVGFGLGKGSEVSGAVAKAAAAARKNLITIPLVEGTLPHDVTAKEGAAVILLKRARKGTGIVAGGAVRPMMELAGVRDVVSKSLGSSNAVNSARATHKALLSLRTAATVAANRRMDAKVFDRKPRTQAAPAAQSE